MNDQLEPLLEAYRFIIEEDKNPASRPEFRRFITKRAAGASKIAEKSATKGGFSKLTAIHFKAKAKPYEQCKEHVPDKERNEFFKSKAEETYSKLKDLDSLSQEEFQKLMGELEVWGEVYIRSTKPDSIKLD